MEFSGIHHINVSVTDLARSADWYASVLGMTRGWEIDDVQGRGRKVVMLHPTEPLRIALTQHQSNDGLAFSEFRTGFDHVAFTVSDRKALEAWQRRFDEMGVDHSPINEGATGWLITFRDPDNLQYEMYTLSK